jgi:flagellar biosynthesis/type III secretory pathway M-ring protein FliF/YscJ
LTAVRNWLETTVGVAPNQPNRIVTVQRVKFDASQAEQAAKEQQAREAARRQALLWQLLPVILLLMVAFFLARVIGKQIRKPAPQPKALAALPGGGAIVCGRCRPRRRNYRRLRTRPERRHRRRGRDAG